MDLSTMNNQDTNNPPRNLGIPLNPIPQTNVGLLEHTAIPIDPMVPITDIPPDFDWMVRQWKLKKIARVSNQNTPGNVLAFMEVLALAESDNADGGALYEKDPSWFKLPFSVSKWWKGTVSHRFTIIKPQRVTGKLLVRWRQDAFKTVHAFADGKVKDGTMRSILKEWDLSESNQFEFDITASLPIQARPTKFHLEHSKNSSNTFVTQIAPFINLSMGSFTLEVAQAISPGNIFPDSFDIIIEKAIKDSQFMTPTDSKSQYTLVVARPPWKNPV
nr:MAG: putative capsid protein 2 [Polycipiviridae sp.]